MISVEIDKALECCDECIVSTMCTLSCEKFKIEIAKLLTKKVSSNYMPLLADEIRNVMVNSPKKQLINLTVGDDWFQI